MVPEIVPLPAAKYLNTRPMRPYPIRLWHDPDQHYWFALDSKVRPVGDFEEVLLNAENAVGGLRVFLYDTPAEADAFSEAVEMLIPHSEYVAHTHPTFVGGRECGVVIVEVEWIGDQVIFRDRRVRTLPGLLKTETSCA
jgi:hypothetical protein